MRNDKKVSHTGYWRAQYQADEESVLFFTGLTASELMDMKLDMGQEWLTKHLAIACMSAKTAQMLWSAERVLRWWNLNWRQYDHYTILPFLHKVTEGERLNVYRDMHLNVFSKDHPQYRALHEQLIGVIDLIIDNVERHAAA